MATQFCDDRFTTQCFAPAFDFRDGHRVDLPHQFGLETQFEYPQIDNTSDLANKLIDLHIPWSHNEQLQKVIAAEYRRKKYRQPYITPPTRQQLGLPVTDELPEIDTSEEPDEDHEGLLRWLLNHVIRQQVPDHMWEEDRPRNMME